MANSDTDIDWAMMLRTSHGAPFEDTTITLSPLFNQTTTGLSTIFNGVNSTTYTNLTPTMAAIPSRPSLFATAANHITNDICMPIVVIIGILGNILNLLVLSRKSMYSSTTIFLIGLAVSDMLLMVCHVPACLYSITAIKTNPSYQLFYRYYHIFRYTFVNVFITCTSWITTAVTVERFLAIRFMLKVKLICTATRAKVALVCIFIISLLFHSTKLFESEPNLNMTHPRLILLTELGKNPTYNTYLYYTNISLAVWIPTILLIIFNFLLIYFLVKHNKSKMNLGTDAAKKVSETRRITLVVIAMVFVFILCHSCGVLLAMLIAVHGRIKILVLHPVYSGLRHISNLLVTVNSGVNFILYCGISTKFRAAFLQTFRCAKEKKKSSTATSTKSATSSSSLRHMGSRIRELEVGTTTKM